jgi:hypothetical protein
VSTETSKLAFNDGWQYAPAPESTDHVQIDDQYELFIGGEFVAPADGRYFESINPATEETLSSVALAAEADVDRAVKAARKAYNGTWSKVKAADRGKYIYRIARILQERAREFAAIESLDGGKPIRESRDIDIPLSAAHFFYYAGWADKLEYAFPGRKSVSWADKLEYAFPGRKSVSLGVAGQIIPWNFPLLMAAWKIAPALACGNTVVLKPAETTPLTAMKLAEVVRDADLPPGVVNISSRVQAKRVPRSSIMRTSTRLHSRVRRKSGALSSVRSPALTRSTRSSSAARRPMSSSRMRRSTRRSKASSTASSSTRDTFAAPVHACSYRNRLQTRWCKNSRIEWRR